MFGRPVQAFGFTPVKGRPRSIYRS